MVRSSEGSRDRRQSHPAKDQERHQARLETTLQSAQGSAGSENMRARTLKPRRVRRVEEGDRCCDWCKAQGHEEEASFVELDNWLTQPTYCAPCLEGVDSGFELVE